MNPRLFLSTFGIIFLAELPDKTLLATILMASRERPWPVFLGAAGGFLVQSGVAVSFGSFFNLLPERWVHLVSGLLFLLFAVMMWKEKEEKEAKEIVHGDMPRHSKSFWATASAAFVAIFIAEWGDLTQLATATMAAHDQAPVTIFTASTLALWSVTALGVLIGSRAKRFIHPETMQKIAAVAFAIIGLKFVASAF